MEKKIYVVYSQKHDVRGEIWDYGVVTKLLFSYDGKQREIGIKRPCLDNNEEAFIELGEKILDSYIEKLLSEESKAQKIMLHYWYLNECISETDGKTYVIANGIVTGHDRLPDSINVHTSAVKEVLINENTGEAEIHTRNNIYYCPLSYCYFERQDEYPEFIPNYEVIKNKYQSKKEEPTIAPGNILLVLSDFDAYYFHGIYYVPLGAEETVDYRAYPHIGTFQDSFLIDVEKQPIDLRYFPHFQNIEFYVEEVDKRPLFIENIGGIPIYVKASCGTLRIEPGERKEVKKENTEKSIPTLPGGDLYPAGVIE